MGRVEHSITILNWFYMLLASLFLVLCHLFLTGFLLLGLFLLKLLLLNKRMGRV